MNTQQLATRVFRAGVWSAAGFVFARIVGLVRLTILARLLVPDDFGLFALATVLIGGVMALSDVGIAAAIIQKRDP
ncbi:MAG: oligosaccharide flippase family protein, partial [Mariprofundaceae bacterium]|nr:oligosaccharide flippase family protein [Mariprofundaceae bacterium]